MTGRRQRNGTVFQESGTAWRWVRQCGGRVRRMALALSAIPRRFSMRPDSFRSSLSPKQPFERYLTELRQRTSPQFFFDESHKPNLVTFAQRTQEDLINTAERICSHQFNLMGSGAVELAGQIDWHRDFKSGYRWKPRYYKAIQLVRWGDDSDSRVVWELNRFQHLVPLGQAYWLTQDPRYAHEAAAQIRSWVDSNPCLFGVNWTCAMEVAIRAVNWIWTFYYFRGAQEWDDAFLEVLVRSLYEHGCYIADRIESYHGITTNHTISDYAGLFYLGLMFPEFDTAERWKTVGLEGLFREIEAQVHPDGVDYESSLHYHALVAEIALDVTMLAQRNGIRIPESTKQRLAAMCEFVEYYTRPDGLSPVVGDADDGRWVILSEYTNRVPADHSYIPQLGAAAFPVGSRSDCCGSGPSSEVVWRCPEILSRQTTNNPAEGDSGSPPTRSFPEGGFYVLRHSGHYLLACAEPVGTAGLGNHQHNDWLGFELAAFGQTWIVDSGSYVYGSDPAARNHFRATAAHNTVRVDGQEIAAIPVRQLFALASAPTIRVCRFVSTSAYDLLEAEHDGYKRLHDPVIHHRTFWFDKTRPFWIVDDYLNGRKCHTLEWHFHFAHGVRLDVEGKCVIATVTHSPIGLRLVPFEVDLGGLEIQECSLSQSYGSRSPSSRVKYLSTDAQLPIRASFLIQPLRDIREPHSHPAENLFREYEQIRVGKEPSLDT